MSSSQRRAGQLSYLSAWGPLLDVPVDRDGHLYGFLGAGALRGGLAGAAAELTDLSRRRFRREGSVHGVRHTPPSFARCGAAEGTTPQVPYEESLGRQPAMLSSQALLILWEERQGVRVMQASVTPEQRKAARREIVRQVEQGATASVARICSAVPMHRTTVYRLLKRVQSDEEKAFVDGRHGHAMKLRGDVLTFLTERCQTNSDLPSSVLRCAIQERFSLTVSISQLNRVRASLGLTYKPVPREKKAQKCLS